MKVSKIYSVISFFVLPFFKLYWFIFKPTTYGVKNIIVNSRKVLMIKNSYGRKRWTFPGGGINKNEKAIDAAIRETKEEVGIEISNLRQIGQFISTEEYKKDTITVFTCDTDSTIFKIDDKEIMEAKWFDLKQLPQNRQPMVDKIISFL